MKQATNRSVTLFALMGITIVVLLVAKYVLLEHYLALGLLGTILLVAILGAVVLLAARWLRTPTRTTVGALVLVGVVGLATVIASPMPHELEKLADDVPVPPGGQKLITVSSRGAPLSHNSATARYVYPAGTNATTLYEEAKRLLEEDGWMIGLANPPPPRDSFNPMGLIQADGRGMFLTLMFTYGDDNGAPPIHLSVSVREP